MSKQFSLLLTMLIIQLAAAAQTGSIDSLLQKLKSAKEDTAAVKLLLAIGVRYEDSDALIAKDYFYKAAALSNKIGYAEGRIAGYTRYSSHFFMTGAYDSVIFYNEKCLEIARGIKDTLNIGYALFNIGMAHSHLSDFVSAIEYCLEGRKIIEGKEPSIEAQLNDRLQALYHQMVQYDKAITFGEKAVQQARELNSPAFLTQALVNLSLSYVIKRMPEKARPLLTEALDLAKKNGNIHHEASALINLSEIEFLEGDYETAKLYTEKCLAVYRQIGSLDGEVIALRSMARYYLHKKDFTNAKILATQSMEMASKNNFRWEHTWASKLMSNIAFAAGDMLAGEKYYQQSEDTLIRMINDLLYGDRKSVV